MSLNVKTDLKVGDVVQIDPASDEVFGGCFMTVTEPKSWGAQGYCVGPDGGKGLAYYRCKTENMVLIGRAEWMNKYDAEQDEDSKK